MRQIDAVRAIKNIVLYKYNILFWVLPKYKKNYLDNSFNANKYLVSIKISYFDGFEHYYKICS